MPRVNNTASDTDSTPLAELEQKLQALSAGQFVTFPQSKSEVLKVRENLTRRRHEIPNADAHLAYLEACLLAEAKGKLKFLG
ncbi:MAG: hypothetical protein EBT03_09385 [Betaproteobacteria bacterium]|nr:hypothetical protein [Betaproteobacteria bacterium]NCA17241.1 hypothetical protein [Betaproteobacteria bacterium]